MKSGKQLKKLFMLFNNLLICKAAVNQDLT